MATKNKEQRIVTVLFLIVVGFGIILGTYGLITINSLNSQLKTLTNSANSPELKSYSTVAATPDATASSVTIPIVAVSSSNNQGVVESLTIKVMPGNDGVLIRTSPFLEPDLQYSANQAVAVAEAKTNLGSNDNFIFNFQASDAQLIGGGSAGSSMTLATIAALENKQIRNDTIMTGTIMADGSIGPIGGVLEKAQAAAAAGYKYFLIPAGQGTITTYTPQVTQQNMGYGMVVQRMRYVPQTVNVIQYTKDKWGLNVVEVSNIDDAMAHFIQ